MEDFKRNIKYGKRLKYGYFQFLDHLIGRGLSFKLHEKSRRKFFTELHQELRASGPGKCTPVDRVKSISRKEFINNYVKKGKPLIFDGAAKDWNCVKTWSLEYLKELHGDDVVAIFNDQGTGKAYEELTLSEILDGIHSGKGKYARFYPLLERHPEHIKDFDYKWLKDRRYGKSIFEAFQVFIGGSGSVSPLHNANQCNLFVQVYGEKKWTLYPNYYAPIIDPEPIRNVYRSAPNRLVNKAFNPFDTEDEKPKLYEYIDSYSVHLKPGDVFWNPPFYWHAVKNFGNSIGVGYRWVAPRYAFSVSPLYTFLDLFAMNPPVWKAYKRYKKTPDLVLLDDWRETRLGQKRSGKDYVHISRPSKQAAGE